MKGTILGVGYAKITETTNEDGSVKITYGEMKWLNTKLSGSRQVNFDPKGDVKEIWADGVVAFVAQNNGGYEGSVTILDLCDDVNVDWYGREVTDDNYTVEYAVTTEMPRFGLIVLYEDTNKPEGVTEVYPYCYVSDRPTIKGKTKEDGTMDYEYVENKIKAKPCPEKVNDKTVVMFYMPGNKRLTAFPKVPTTNTTTE